MSMVIKVPPIPAGIVTDPELKQALGRLELQLVLEHVHGCIRSVQRSTPSHFHLIHTLERAAVAILWLYQQKESLRADLRGCVCRVAPGECPKCGYTPPSDAGDDEAQGALPFVTEAFCEACDRECQTTLADERVLCETCAADPMNQPAWDGADYTLGEAIDRAENANDSARDA